MGTELAPGSNRSSRLAVLPLRPCTMDNHAIFRSRVAARARQCGLPNGKSCHPSVYLEHQQQSGHRLWMYLQPAIALAAQLQQ